MNLKMSYHVETPKKWHSQIIPDGSLKHAGPGAGADIVSSKVLYKHKGTGNHILFYDSHWKHGHGMKQVRSSRSMARHCSIAAMQGQNYFRKDPEGQGEANASDCLSICPHQHL